MAYNKAREELKWKKWKLKEEEQMRMLGMKEDSIQKLRDSDWNVFKEERCYQEHRVIFAENSEWESTDMEEQDVYSVSGLLDVITDERLLHILLKADRRTLQILLMKMMGFSVSEIAARLKISERAIYCRIDRLKKKIKKIF